MRSGCAARLLECKQETPARDGALLRAGRHRHHGRRAPPLEPQELQGERGVPVARAAAKRNREPGHRAALVATRRQRARRHFRSGYYYVAEAEAGSHSRSRPWQPQQQQPQQQQSQQQQSSSSSSSSSGTAVVQRAAARGPTQWHCSGAACCCARPDGRRQECCSGEALRRSSSQHGSSASGSACAAPRAARGSASYCSGEALRLGGLRLFARPTLAWPSLGGGEGTGR